MIVPSRSPELDLFKSMLVVGMVSIHVFQLLSRSLPDWVDHVSDWVNLTTFSGFLLAMGIGVGMASERARTLPQKFRPVLIMLGATCLSSLAFMLLVERAPPSWQLAIDIVFLRRLFGWSEFLASFFMLYLLLAVARPVIVRMAIDPLALGLTVSLSFASTWIVADLGLPGSATLIGTTQFASFPLLPYLPWFLLGIRLGINSGRLKWEVWLLATLCTGVLAWQLLRTDTLPGRFPPTVLWVVGPALPLLTYWSLARIAAGAAARLQLMLLPGRHVLSYLLVSNLLIFGARYLWGRPIRDVAGWLFFSLVLLGGISVVWLLVETRRRLVADCAVAS